MIVLVLAIYAAVMLLDFRQTWKAKNKALKWSCLILYAAGAVILCLYTLNITVPSPSGPITNLVSSYFSLK